MGDAYLLRTLSIDFQTKENDRKGCESEDALSVSVFFSH